MPIFDRYSNVLYLLPTVTTGRGGGRTGGGDVESLHFLVKVDFVVLLVVGSDGLTAGSGTVRAGRSCVGGSAVVGTVVVVCVATDGRPTTMGPRG
jgi:hypothetical protein